MFYLTKVNTWGLETDITAKMTHLRYTLDAITQRAWHFHPRSHTIFHIFHFSSTPATVLKTYAALTKQLTDCCPPNCTEGQKIHMSGDFHWTPLASCLAVVHEDLPHYAPWRYCYLAIVFFQCKGPWEIRRPRGMSQPGFSKKSSLGICQACRLCPL